MFTFTPFTTTPYMTTAIIIAILKALLCGLSNPELEKELLIRLSVDPTMRKTLKKWRTGVRPGTAVGLRKDEPYQRIMEELLAEHTEGELSSLFSRVEEGE